MAKAPGKPEQKAFADIRDLLKNVRAMFPTLTRPAAAKVTAELATLQAEVEAARAELDPIKDPGPPFDPTNPETAGRLVALALLAQDRIPLAQIARSYGSGVYAIYYTGDHPAYAPVSGTETPLYVGKADPKIVDATNPREQGAQLYGRLSDHRRMISAVERYATESRLPHVLRVADFECRRLVCATNAQLVAERHLINTFRPVWNNEVNIAFGISKHGDAATTRKNKRSPWDVIHPGRAWAMATTEDQVPGDEVLARLKAHFEITPPHHDRNVLLAGLLEAFKQHAPLTSPEVAAAEDATSEADPSAETE